MGMQVGSSRPGYQPTPGCQGRGAGLCRQAGWQCHKAARSSCIMRTGPPRGLHTEVQPGCRLDRRAASGGRRARTVGPFLEKEQEVSGDAWSLFALRMRRGVLSPAEWAPPAGGSHLLLAAMPHA